MNYKIKHLVVCGIFFFGCLFAHPFHSSIISLKFNDNSRSIEITMRVFANDLEKTLNQINDLNKLKEQGIISDEEFKKAKEKILN